MDIDSEEDPDHLWDLLEKNPYSSLIYKSFTNVYRFYVAYVSELLLDDELDLMGTTADNIDPCLLDLAASKLDKERAFRAGIPL